MRSPKFMNKILCFDDNKISKDFLISFPLTFKTTNIDLFIKELTLDVDAYDAIFINTNLLKEFTSKDIDFWISELTKVNAYKYIYIEDLTKNDNIKYVYSLEHKYIFTNEHTCSYIFNTLSCDFKRINQQKNIYKQTIFENENTSKIITALKNNKITPFFQPIRNNITNEIEKYEALARLEINGCLYVAPSEFIDLSKKTELMNIVTKNMISKTFEYFYNKDIEFSINFSLNDILSKEITNFLFDLLKSFNRPFNVVIEIIENENLLNYENEVFNFIMEIKKLKAKISIDDFGTGYSNFVNFMRFPKIDYLKFDGSLISELICKRNYKQNETIIKNMVNIANTIGARTIAEFVSNKVLDEKVKSLGINYSQGYYIGKPEKEILQ